MPDAKVRGYTARRFSFNVPGGRCEECFGNGQICIEMHFLPNVWVECQACKGRRYNEDTLAVRYDGKTIDDVLKMSCEQGLEHFSNIPKIRRILKTLCDVGLDYVTLGQSAPTLSGGEAQRVKLSAELARPDTGRTLYLLDEPTTGLHFNDLMKLLEVIQRLVDVGNTVVLIEHNLDIIKAADWVIDMGPEAGLGGGQVVVQGTPENVVAYAEAALKQSASAPKKKTPTKKAATKKPASKKTPAMDRSYTGEALIPVLAEGPYKKRKPYDPAKDDRWKRGDLDIEDVGVDAELPWEADGRRWHTQDRVGREGEPIQWDGRVLAEVVDRIENNECFVDTDWSQRTAVDIAGRQKSDGWFFHAVTGDPWFVKLKFRVRPKAFKREDLIQRIPLLTANQLEDIPVYGNTPRVKLTSAKASWQEIEIKVHSWDEINHNDFWKFVDDAIASFQNKLEVVEKKVDEHSPWAKLGKKWHLMKKGFTPDTEIQWDFKMLKKTCSLLSELAPGGEFVWNNKEVVHFVLPEQKQPWVILQTKKPDALWVNVCGPSGSLKLGQAIGLGDSVNSEIDNGRDVIRMAMSSVEQIESKGLQKFLNNHLQTMLAGIG